MGNFANYTKTFADKHNVNVMLGMSYSSNTSFGVTGGINGSRSGDIRPSEVEQLLGDPTKAKTLLGWNPQQTSFEELVRIMAAHDMKFVKKLHARSKEEE